MENVDEKVVDVLGQNEALRGLLKNVIAMKLISAAIVIIIGIIVIKVCKKVIDSLILNEKTSKIANRAKLETISRLLYSIIRAVIIFLILTTILDIIGINTSSLIATAGIGGIALAFGSQTIIQDFIKGIFIIFDDKINVGDWIIVAGEEGEVEEVNLRTTKIRDFNGSLHIIPNSKIDTVQNFNRGNAKSQVIFRVSYDTKLSEVKDIIKVVAKKAKEKKEFKNKFINPFEFFEISAFEEHSYLVKMIATVKPGTQWAIARYAKELIKLEMEERNIQASVVEYQEDKKNEKI